MPDFQPLTLKRAEHAYNRYFEQVPPGIPLESVAHPDYWMHVRKSFRPFDVIECVALDGTFSATVRVVQTSKDGVSLKLRVEQVWRASTAAKAEPIKAEKEARYVTQHKGRGVWAVVEKRTGEVVADGFDKDSAEAERNRLEAVADAEAQKIAA